MSLDRFNPDLAVHRLVQELKRDRILREEFERDPAAVAERSGLSAAEVAAIRGRDFKALFELGMHPFLLGQLSRLIFGTTEGTATSAAAEALVASLRGEDAPAS
ncbi:extradiol ring-cleavage dioxygenase [Micromonospora radicis]|uniref:Extradiol ring-cleavage dioxygenase n=1 Tax=Micromonospora radicis TaxID=1894971 RepID=A0A418MZ52_9ACTN|nr:extradiol ring-cleavage dioxygenase [Micromonospora radicis]RIV40022.1 extradiol ring-cleavage dioxygenase [Micromonospora radicis]